MKQIRIYKLEFERSEFERSKFERSDDYYVRPQDRFKFNVFIIFYMVFIGIVSFLIYSSFPSKEIFETTGKSNEDFGALTQKNMNRYEYRIIFSDPILEKMEHRISEIERHVYKLYTQIETAKRNNCQK